LKWRKTGVWKYYEQNGKRKPAELKEDEF